MTGAINIIVSTTIILIFALGLACNLLVKRKYIRMFKTMRNNAHDKNLLIIERDYRHGYLKDRVERIKIFVEKEYYEIKVAGIPLYVFEDFTISSVYLNVLLGLTFTFILVALPEEKLSFNLYLLGILGLTSGTLLYGTRAVMGIAALKDIFKVKLCDYLEYELELFNEDEKDEANIIYKKEQKKNRHAAQDKESAWRLDSDHESGTDSLPDDGETEDIEIVFDESFILQMLDEILG